MTQSTTPTRPSRVNIAFTAVADEAARRLVERFPIASPLDVARIGVAFALRENLPRARPADFGATSGSNYNVGSVDPQGELRDLLLALRPEIDEDPYRIIETLMSLGTIELDKHVAKGRILSLRDLINPAASPA